MAPNKKNRDKIKDTDEFKENSELRDIWRLSERYKEEFMLSESDMKSFIKSTELRIDSLTQSKVHFQSVTDVSYNLT